MNGHSRRLPEPGGEWASDPRRAGLAHRNGHPWDQVHPPFRMHRCIAQSRLRWTFRTRCGSSVAAVLWCACGGVTFPGLDGRWIAKNLRRDLWGATYPAWHRVLIDLNLPAPGRRCLPSVGVDTIEKERRDDVQDLVIRFPSDTNRVEWPATG
jgi:hypothetical protein